MAERCSTCAPPVHKIYVHRGWNGLWYVGCDWCSGAFMPLGRETQSEALAVGIRHQKERMTDAPPQP